MSPLALALIFVVTATVSSIGVGLFRRLCLTFQWYDIPNERSSHVVPTPRGGGVAVVIALALAAFGLSVQADSYHLALILSPALAISVLGFVDDRTGISAGIRFAIQLVAAATSIFLIDRWFDLSGTITLLGGSLPVTVVAIFLTVFTAWMTNLYNFMDGIDGIEGLQVASVAALAAGFSYHRGSSFTALYLLLVAGALGFLVWNWQPARIFMGDVASGFFGFVLAVLAILSAVERSFPLEVSLMLNATFLADTFYTLVRRVIDGQKPHQAHRSHAYQKLTQRGFKHSTVSLWYGLVNVVWLGPIAWLVLRHDIAVWLGLTLAYVPLFAICYLTRAGTRESVTA